MLSDLDRAGPPPNRALGRTPTRVLIIKLSAMGDSLCLFTRVLQLALAFPGATIDWLTSNRSNP
ncbi:glycosyltransferase family 9 protein, partial [Burkholderia pseudomallei]